MSTELSPDPASQPEESGVVDHKTLGQEVRGWLKDILAALVMAILIVVFVVQPVKVEGTSMSPRLQPQDRIFVNKFGYRLSPVERGDIVVFWYPRDVGKSFIKRVVGMPGERVEIRAGVVYLDGRRLTEPYLPLLADGRSHGPQVIPQNHYFVLGDNRVSSSDSRDWGSVPSENILGEAFFRYWPLWQLGLID